jgi:hypothetical protein
MPMTPSRSSRVIIFTESRNSVEEIVSALTRHKPLIKAMPFVGQSSTKSKGLSQKQQSEIVTKFRDGGYNTLVATCIGEEGLDIGEVDLIISYDAPPSIIRTIQRMGRTGRARVGRSVLLAYQGAEEESIKNVMRKNKQLTSQLKGEVKGQIFPLLSVVHGPSAVAAALPTPPSSTYGLHLMMPLGLIPRCEFVFFQPSAVGQKRKALACGDVSDEESDDGDANFKTAKRGIDKPAYLTLAEEQRLQRFQLSYEEVQNLQFDVSRFIKMNSVMQSVSRIGHSDNCRDLVKLIRLCDDLNDESILNEYEDKMSRLRFAVETEPAHVAALPRPRRTESVHGRVRSHATTTSARISDDDDEENST